jgi:hypothetical protein
MLTRRLEARGQSANVRRQRYDDLWQLGWRGDMQGIGEAIKHFYEEFIFRDVLGYVTPGTILIGCVLLLYYKDPTVVINTLSAIPVLLYIPIFGIAFVVGFALENLGEMLHVLKWHERKNDKEHLVIVKEFHDSVWGTEDKDPRGSEWLERTRERITAKAYLSGNSVFAIGLCVMLILITKLNSSLFPSAVLVLSLILTIALYRGHRHEHEIQTIWENEVVDNKHS